jgi:hypothetical protein
VLVEFDMTQEMKKLLESFRKSTDLKEATIPEDKLDDAALFFKSLMGLNEPTKRFIHPRLQAMLKSVEDLAKFLNVMQSKETLDITDPEIQRIVLDPQIKNVVEGIFTEWLMSDDQFVEPFAAALKKINLSQNQEQDIENVEEPARSPEQDLTSAPAGRRRPKP